MKNARREKITSKAGAMLVCECNVLKAAELEFMDIPWSSFPSL